jgi:hypothetical protein
MAREARTTAAPAKAPQQKSWASRHKVAIIVWSAVAVTAALFGYWVYVGGQHDE